MRLLTLLLLLQLAQSASSAVLRIHITDETGKPVWTRLEVYGPEGKKRLPAKAILSARAENPESGYRSSFVVLGECTIQTDIGAHRVIAEHGLEYERFEKSVDVTAKGAELRIQLKPWIRARDRGWWSGDLHVHRPPEDVSALALAEDLNLSVVFTMWNAANLWAGKLVPADPVMRISPNHLATLMNAEDERGGGAWMMHQIPEPLLVPSARWFPPGMRFVRLARTRRAAGATFPWFELEKLIWWEAPVMMALEPPDSIGTLNNHFQQYGMLDSEAWGRPRDREHYPGFAGFAAYANELYYRYLNLGFRIPASAGSASGVLPNPVGYNRVYVPLGQLPFTVENWYRALRQGQGFVTNGPMLFFNAAERNGRVTGSVEILSRDIVDRVEFIANGQVLRSDAIDSKQWKGTFAFDVGNHSWIAARCFVKGSPGVRMAHSSPMWLSGKWDARRDARYFLEWVEELIAQTKSDPMRFKTPGELEKILNLYDQARQFYAARM